MEKTASSAWGASPMELLPARALLVLLVTLGLGLGTWLWLGWQAPPLEIGQFVRLTHDGHDKHGNLSDGIPSPIVTDGTRLYFVESKAGFSDLVQVLATGGEVLPIPSPFRNVRLTDISPDRTHLLVGNSESPTTPEHSFYSLPISGGSARRLGDFQAHDASWSPDGLHLAYATNDRLILAKSDGSAMREVAQGLGAIWWLRWSPDSARLRFTVTQPKTQTNSIWEIASDGTHLQNVSRDWNLPGDQCCGSWTPDQRYFVFQSSLWSGISLKAVSERRLRFRRPLTRSLSSGPIWASSPSTSLDGKKLFFIGWQPRTETIRYDPKQKSFVSFLAEISAEALDFSKDGKWIAYTQYPEGSLWRARGSFGNPEWFSDDTFLSVVDVQSMSVVRIRVSNGATEPVANLQNERAALTAVGIWTGLAPDGSLLTLRDLSTQELYSVELDTH